MDPKSSPKGSGTALLVGPPRVLAGSGPKSSGTRGPHFDRKISGRGSGGLPRGPAGTAQGPTSQKGQGGTGSPFVDPVPRTHRKIKFLYRDSILDNNKSVSFQVIRKKNYIKIF